MEPLDSAIIEDLESLRVYSSALRRQIVAELCARPMSIHELAAALNVPFTRLYYHIHLLEKHGFIHLVEIRPGPGAIAEKFYRVRARMFLVDSALMQPGSPSRQETLDYLLDVTLMNARQEIRESAQRGLIDLSQRGPHPSRLQLLAAHLILDAADVQELHLELTALMQRYSQQPASADALHYGFTIALYPVSTDETS